MGLLAAIGLALLVWGVIVVSLPLIVIGIVLIVVDGGIYTHRRF